MSVRGLLVVALLAIAVLLPGVARAVEAPYPPPPNDAECVETTVEAGADQQCSAGGFEPGSTVLVTIFGNTFPVTADALGVAFADFEVPCGTPPGTYSISFEGVDPDGEPRVVETSFEVRGSVCAGGSPLPRTGAFLQTWMVIAAAVILAGVLLLLLVRRRRRAPTASA